MRVIFSCFERALGKDEKGRTYVEIESREIFTRDIESEYC